MGRVAAQVEVQRKPYCIELPLGEHFTDTPPTSVATTPYLLPVNQRIDNVR